MSWTASTNTQTFTATLLVTWDVNIETNVLVLPIPGGNPVIRNLGSGGLQRTFRIVLGWGGSAATAVVSQFHALETLVDTQHLGWDGGVGGSYTATTWVTVSDDTSLNGSYILKLGAPEWEGSSCQVNVTAQKVY